MEGTNSNFLPLYIRTTRSLNSKFLPLYTSHYNFICYLFLRKNYTISYKQSSIIALSLALLARSEHLGMWEYDGNVHRIRVILVFKI